MASSSENRPNSEDESRGNEQISENTLVEAVTGFSERKSQSDVSILNESQRNRPESASSPSSTDESDETDNRTTAATIGDDESSVSSERSSSSERDSVVSEPGSAANAMPSPPAQAMERPHGYDPFRIPSSVFERSKSSTPVDWSLASNESLFSLHVGNASFSRDHFVLGDSAARSGELGALGEATSPSPAPAAGIEGNGLEAEEEEEEEAASVEEVAMLIGRGDTSSKRSPPPPPPPTPLSNSSRHSRLSGGSGSSTRSFAFPILPSGMKSESMRPETEKLRHSETLPGTRKTSKSKFANRWLPCLSWCCCLSWCSWPRNCSLPRYYCFHCSGFRRRCCSRCRFRCCSCNCNSCSNCCCY